MNPLRLLRSAALLLALATSAGAQTLDSAFLAGLRWRPIGPANMSGRVTDIEGLPSPSRTFYVLTAAGGVFKTTNGGTIFRPLFQTERVVSGGDLAIAPSDSMQLWLGTGEEDSRNSISPGGGIYKSTDGGLGWQLMGLEKTEHIGRVVVHPTNPDIVYVAAVGAAWRSNPERGLYKTTDGGRTWQRIKYISDRAGFVDVAMDPTNPDVLFASSWERVRGPYFLNSGGPGSALWKTTDGGRSWTEVKGGGFPATRKGRIGLAIAPSNARVLYALVEAEPPADKPWRANPPGTPGNNCRNVGAGGCGLYRSTDGGASWQWMNGNNVRPFYYSQVRIDIKNPDRVYWSSTPVNFSNDGGQTIGTTTGGLHVDHHAMWLDPANQHHFIVGNDGGIGITWDKGGSYQFINTFPIGQFYNISYDMRVPYFVCGGLQDNGSWCGPSRKAGSDAAITNADWIKFSGGDGFVTQQDPRNWNIVYAESQGGNMARYDLNTGVRTPLRKPSWLDAYRAFEDSIVIQRGDPTSPLTPAVQQRLSDLRMRQVSDSVSLNLRWNWNTPFLLSAHNPDVFYAGANRVLKSTKRGEDMRPVSPDLTYNDSAKIFISTRMTGGVTKDTTGAETYGTIVSLNESALRPGVLFAGTDDGRLWSTRNDGESWVEHTAAFAKLVPARTYVSRIEPSRVSLERFYVTFDNHRNGDFTPYVLVTEDGGKTFRSIAGSLPRGGPDFVHVMREDPVNPNLLYVGTDVGVYVSLDRGGSWTKFMNGLPTVPVHDLKIHPRDRELIAGTHGRSIWIADVAPLQQYSAQVAGAADPVLLEIKPALSYFDQSTDYEIGQQTFAAESPPFGAEITYWVGAPAGARAQVIILDQQGDTVQTLNGPASRGLQRVFWNLRKRAEPARPLSPAEQRDSARLEVRVAFVSDSLVRAGMRRDTVDRLIAEWRNVQRIGSLPARSRRQRSQPSSTSGGELSSALGVFNARPSETEPRAPGAAARGGSGEAQAGESVDPDQLRMIVNLLQLPGRPNLRPLTSSFFSQQTLVEPGVYTAVLKVGDEVVGRRTFEVIKAGD
ncbi:MAG: WD40/YVTN/BNR-like repeat-containing protein [Gemmatimonadota bacterium]